MPRPDSFVWRPLLRPRPQLCLRLRHVDRVVGSIGDTTPSLHPFATGSSASSRLERHGLYGHNRNGRAQEDSK